MSEPRDPAPSTQDPAPGAQHPAPGAQHPAPGAQHPAPKVLVVGLEKSGQASARLLLQHNADVLTTDLRPEAALAGIPFAVQTPEVFENAGLIVISPGVPADLAPLNAARARGVRVIGEVELAAPYLQGQTIAVTGSNGKTTTTSLIGHILRGCGIPAQVGGNIGTPVTAMVDASRPDQWNVLELSSFQLETAFEFRARVAICLNVTQNHLDRHHTFAAYAAAKGRLFETQQPGDFAILNADDPTCASYASLTRGAAYWFSSTREVTPGAWLDGDLIRVEGEPLMQAAEVPIRGRHNLENVMAAGIAARLAGARLADIAAAVRTFHAVEHRLEFVRALSGVDFYNDSKATSVDATLKALDAFNGGLWVILGGKDKGLDYSALRAPLYRKARAVLLIGAAAEKIAAALLGYGIPMVHSGTLDAAVPYAYACAHPGDTVLLAPACASFDQFRSFEHRGQVFKDIVGQLEPKE